MPRLPLFVRYLSLCLVIMATQPFAEAGPRDGRRFDPGAALSAPAAGAPEALAAVNPAIGHWDVTYRRFLEGEELNAAVGFAEITFMNRGHSVMERFHVPDFDGEGNELSTISFLAYTPSLQHWVLGVANSWTESIRMYSGGLEGTGMVLFGAARQAGGGTLTEYRVNSQATGPDAMVSVLEESTDHGATWNKVVVKEYVRRATPSEAFSGGEGFGEPAPGLPEEARQFDFFVGRFDENHWLKLPNGPVQFPVNGTAIHALNGHGVLEFSWYDIDPSLPDAATSIVRIYNRQMRRWESLYVTNRFNGLLYFGGALEEDRMVLHKFDSDTGDVPISRWVFHDMEPDSYKWFAESSQDRGATWDTTWVITSARQSQ